MYTIPSFFPSFFPNFSTKFINNLVKTKKTKTKEQFIYQLSNLHFAASVANAIQKKLKNLSKKECKKAQQKYKVKKEALGTFDKNCKFLTKSSVFINNTFDSFINEQYQKFVKIK